ncbi:hypothetical protein Gotur_018530 [Gossypium turneri]
METEDVHVPSFLRRVYNTRGRQFTTRPIG